jgi:hypothetical protein
MSTVGSNKAGHAALEGVRRNGEWSRDMDVLLGSCVYWKRWNGVDAADGGNAEDLAFEAVLV